MEWTLKSPFPGTGPYSRDVGNADLSLPQAAAPLNRRPLQRQISSNVKGIEKSGENVLYLLKLREEKLRKVKERLAKERRRVNREMALLRTVIGAPAISFTDPLYSIAQSQPEQWNSELGGPRGVGDSDFGLEETAPTERPEQDLHEQSETHFETQSKDDEEEFEGG